MKTFLSLLFFMLLLRQGLTQIVIDSLVNRQNVLATRVMYSVRIPGKSLSQFDIPGAIFDVDFNKKVVGINAEVLNKCLSVTRGGSTKNFSENFTFARLKLNDPFTSAEVKQKGEWVTIGSPGKEYDLNAGYLSYLASTELINENEMSYAFNGGVGNEILSRYLTPSELIAFKHKTEGKIYNGKTQYENAFIGFPTLLSPAVSKKIKDLTTVYPATYEKLSGTWIKCDWEAFQGLHTTFQVASGFSSVVSDPNSMIVATSVDNFIDAIREYPGMAGLVVEETGGVTFGTPLIDLPTDFGMSVPENTLRRFDIYIITFAISFDDLNSNDFEFLKFNINCPADVLALELVPERFGAIKNVKKEAGLPSIKVGDAVEVGSIYKQTVAYQYLEPELVALGLQQNNFGWRLKGKALDMGCLKMMAVLGVKKGTQKAKIRMDIQVKRAPSFLFAEEVVVQPVETELLFR